MVMPDWTAPKPPPKIEFETAPKGELGLDFGAGTHDKLARPMDRLAAVIVDVIILLVPIFVLLSAPFKRLMTASFVLGSDSDFIGLIAIMITLALVLIISYQAVLHYFFAATVGKMLFDLRVRPMFKGERISFFSFVIRAMIWILEFLLIGLPFLSVFSNYRRRALHDRVCDTVVVTRGHAFVVSPNRWERALVRGFFAATLALSFIAAALQLRTFLDHSKGDKAIATLLERESSSCEAVSRGFENENSRPHARLEMAMTLYAAGLAERNCLESELERELAMQTAVGPITYLAQAFVNSDDAEASNSYLDEVCDDSPESTECAMSKVVSKWSEEDWGAVEHILTEAPPGSGYLEVWAVRHFMKQARYGRAIAYLDKMVDHKELAEFTLVQRIKALYNMYRGAEAEVALAQALPVLAKEEGDDISSWVCAQELQKGCAALTATACRNFRAGENAEIDFEHTGPALAQVMALECRGNDNIDYLSFSQAVKDEDWQNFFRANLKQQKEDKTAAYRFFSDVIVSPNAPELLRIESLRRIARFASHRQMADVVEMWQNFDNKEAWVKGGNLLFARFAKDNEQEWALRIARHLSNSDNMSPQALAQLPEFMLSSPTLRAPANVKNKLKTNANANANANLNADAKAKAKASED